ncbi:MAG: hypothetical protein ABIZ70_08835 [Gemmatimonadales bacterium]
MAKTPVTGCFSTPLDAILGTRAKIAVLRVLSGLASPLGMREIARRSGMAYRSAEVAIKELTQLGILERIDGSRERLLRISATHRLAGALGALLRAEEDYRPALRAELRALAERAKREGVVEVAIVGLAARQEERIGDPLELLILAQDEPTANRWVKTFGLAAQELERRFGARLSVTGYSLERARQLWLSRTVTAERSIATAIPLIGGEVAELLSAR